MQARLEILPLPIVPCPIRPTEAAWGLQGLPVLGCGAVHAIRTGHQKRTEATPVDFLRSKGCRFNKK